jgi:penicillin-binding protein 1A
MWVQYMGEALRGLPERTLEQPAGMVSVRIDPQTGLLASTENPEGIFETFFAENVPLQEQRDTVVDTGLAKDAPGAVVTEQLF